jgi:hypothetical protein
MRQWIGLLKQHGRQENGDLPAFSQAARREQLSNGYAMGDQFTEQITVLIHRQQRHLVSSSIAQVETPISKANLVCEFTAARHNQQRIVCAQTSNFLAQIR